MESGKQYVKLQNVATVQTTCTVCVGTVRVRRQEKDLFGRNGPWGARLDLASCVLTSELIGSLPRNKHQFITIHFAAPGLAAHNYRARFRHLSIPRTPIGANHGSRWS